MRAQQRTGQQTATGRGARDIGVIAALHHVDVIARGRQAPSCPCNGGEGQVKAVVSMTGTLDGDACNASPTTATAAWTGSWVSFTLADNLPPRQGAWQRAQQSSQQRSLPLDPFCAFTTTPIDLQLTQETTSVGCIELLHLMLCFCLSSFFIDLVFKS